jgi:hypothetical protein
MLNDTKTIHQFKIRKAAYSETGRMDPEFMTPGCSIRQNDRVTWVEIVTHEDNGRQVLVWATLEEGELKKLVDKWRQR